MSERITREQLDAQVVIINRMTDTDAYYIHGAYGGWTLYRHSGLGSTNVFNSGHVSKRELYNALHAFRAGLESA